MSLLDGIRAISARFGLSTSSATLKKTSSSGVKTRDTEDDLIDESSLDGTLTANSAQHSKILEALEKQEKEKKRIESEIKSLEAEIESLTKQLSRATGAGAKKIQNEIDSKNSQISSLENSLSRINRAIATMQDVASKSEMLENTILLQKAIKSKNIGANNNDGTQQETEAAAYNSGSRFKGYNSERGNALLNAAKSMYGNVKRGNNHCAKGVSQAISSVFGYYPGKNGNNYDDFLEKRSDWKEITNEIKNVDDLSNLPAGAVVSWDSFGTGASARYGHVYIADGKGGEISDYYSASNKERNRYRASTGGKFRVFIPV